MSDKTRVLTLLMRASAADFGAGMQKAREHAVSANEGIRDSFKKNFGEAGTGSGNTINAGFAIQGVNRFISIVRKAGDALKEASVVDFKGTNLERAATLFEKLPIVGNAIGAVNSVADGFSQLAYQIAKAQGASEGFARSFLTARVVAQEAIERAKADAAGQDEFLKQKSKRTDLETEIRLVGKSEEERARIQLARQQRNAIEAEEERLRAAKAVLEDAEASKIEKARATEQLKGYEQRINLQKELHAAQLKELESVQAVAAAKEKADLEEKERHKIEAAEKAAEEERERNRQEAKRRTADNVARLSTAASSAQRGSVDEYNVLVAAQMDKMKGYETKAAEDRSAIRTNTEMMAEALKEIRAVKSGRI